MAGNTIKFFSPIVLIALVLSAPVQAESGDKVGELLHNFTFEDPGGVRKAVSDYRGEVLVVKLWATWCGVCRAKWPNYQALHSKLENQPGVRMITLSIFEDPADSQAWVDKQGYDVPLYKNLINNKGAISVANGPEYFIKGTPTVFLVDKSGVIRKKTIGFAGEIAERDVRQLL